MGTRSVVAVRQEGGGWKGRYVHWDGYPEGVGAAVKEIIARDGRELAVQVLTEKNYGWSSVDAQPEQQLGFGLTDGRFRAIPGYGVAYTTEEGQSSPEEWITDETAGDSGASTPTSSSRTLRHLGGAVMESVTIKGRHGNSEVLTVKGLRHSLDNLMAETPEAADRPVFLGHDPEGNPPFHAFVNTAGYPGLAEATILGHEAMVLWAGYRRPGTTTSTGMRTDAQPHHQPRHHRRPQGEDRRDRAGHVPAQREGMGRRSTSTASPDATGDPGHHLPPGGCGHPGGG